MIALPEKNGDPGDPIALTLTLTPSRRHALTMDQVATGASRNGILSHALFEGDALDWGDFFANFPSF